MSAASASSACRLDEARTRWPASAEGWLERAGPALRATLERERVAFPAPALLDPCSDLSPALVLFDLAPEAVYELLRQTERQIEFLPQVRDIRPVSRTPDVRVDRHEVSILFRRIVYHIEQHGSPGDLRIWWRLSPAHPNDLRALEGFWQLEPLEGGRTLGVYGSLVDVGPVLPQRMQARLTRNNVEESIRALRAWVERQDAADARAHAAGAAR